MPKNIKKAKNLKGLSIYQDKYHGTVYYDFFTKNGYVIEDDDVKTYTLSIAFLPLAIVLFYFLFQFKINVLVALAIAIGFYVVAQIIYRFAFLYKLECIENYKSEKSGNAIDNLTSNYSKPRLIVLVIFLIALVVVTAAYILTSDFEGATLTALWILVAATFIFLLIVIYALIRKNKN